MKPKHPNPPASLALSSRVTAAVLQYIKDRDLTNQTGAPSKKEENTQGIFDAITLQFGENVYAERLAGSIFIYVPVSPEFKPACYRLSLFDTPENREKTKDFSEAPFCDWL